MEKTNGTKETWRIIGLFPDGENGEYVIRVRKVGYESVAYHSSSSPYINHWPNTTLYSTWSSTYSTTNYKNTVNFKVYLGTTSSFNSYNSEEFYKMERVLESKGSAGASAGGLTSAVVSVGLMYPSDYGYAVLESDCARTIKLYYGGYSGNSACYKNNWLYQGSSTWQWLISPNVSYSSSAFGISPTGFVNITSAYADGLGVSVTGIGYASPVMALSSTIVVTGSGTQSDPYVMQ